MRKLINKKKEEMGIPVAAASSDRKALNAAKEVKAKRIVRPCMVHESEMKAEAERNGNLTGENANKDGRNHERADEVDADNEGDQDDDIASED